MRIIALMLSMVLVTPAFGMGAWDGMKSENEVYQAFEQVDHPPFTSDNRGLMTLGVVAVPVYQAATIGWTSAAHASFSELTNFWFVPYGIVVGAWLESRSAPAKFGKYEYNGHEGNGEVAKWQRDPEHPGWNRLTRYDTIGPGTPERGDTGMPFDRISG